MVFKQIDRKLRENGWYLVRVSSSHSIYKHDDFSINISLPGHGKESVSSGVARTIERMTGISFR